MAAEQTFSSPGFFETETLAGQAPGGVLGVPAGVVGTAVMGPAFVPITVSSFSEFTSLFGGLDHNYMAPYAVAEFLRNRSALTFVRVLGAGGNSSAPTSPPPTSHRSPPMPRSPRRGLPAIRSVP